MKFHCYVAALPAPPAPSAGVLLEAIERGIGFMHGLTRRHVAVAVTTITCCHPCWACVARSAVQRPLRAQSVAGWH